MVGWATDRAAERDEDDASGLAASGAPAAADLREEDREGDLLGALRVGLVSRECDPRLAFLSQVSHDSITRNRT